MKSLKVFHKEIYYIRLTQRGGGGGKVRSQRPLRIRPWFHGISFLMITLTEQEHFVSSFDEVFQDHQFRVQTAHQ